MNKNIEQAQALTALQFSVNFGQKQDTDTNMQHNLNDSITLKGILANAAKEAIGTLKARNQAAQAAKLVKLN